MQKFLVLYMAPVATMDAMMKDMTPEKAKEGMAEWQKWLTDNAAHFADMGAPAGRNKRVSAKGVEDVRNDIMGYSIIQAASHDEAVKILEKMPNMDMQGGYTEVMPLADMSKM